MGAKFREFLCILKASNIGKLKFLQEIQNDWLPAGQIVWKVLKCGENDESQREWTNLYFNSDIFTWNVELH